MTLRRPYILVVDDDSDIREAFRDTLVDGGYEVRTAGDGAEALSLLLSSRERPGLMLLDLMMPRRNGWELMASLRDSTMLIDVPIVIVSAFSGSPPAGAIAWLRKPLRSEALLGVVKKHLRAA
jgi:CheY-like chemotaxis protein